MNFRAANIADVDGIALVHVEAWKTTYRGILSGGFLANLALEPRRENWREILSRSIPSEFAFVAEADGRIVGFANGGSERTGDPDFVGELYAIYLLEPYQRRGIGTELIRRCIEALRQHGLNSMKVWVLKDNPCRSFYERQGGQFLGEKPIQIGETMLWEVAYGWKQLECFRQIRRARSSDQSEWLRLRQALWPEVQLGELANDMQAWLKADQCAALVVERPDGNLCGFLEVAIRPCNVHGTIGRFGYIEGWYVDVDCRRQGIGKSLVEAAEHWAKSKGCYEMLSDAHWENDLSQSVHRSLGFRDVERLVHFCKPID